MKLTFIFEFKEALHVKRKERQQNILLLSIEVNKAINRLTHRSLIVIKSKQTLFKYLLFSKLF
jgi:hypothetical protein